MAARQKYLLLRSKTWFVKYPVHVSEAYPGSPQHIVRTTGTRDVLEAQRRVHSVVAGIQAELAVARRKAELTPRSSPVVRRARSLAIEAEATARSLMAGEISRAQAEDWISHEVDELRSLSDESGTSLGDCQPAVVPHEEEDQDASVAKVVADVVHRILGPSEDSFRWLVDRRLEECRKFGAAVATVDAKRRALDLVGSHFGWSSSPFDVTKASAKKFAIEKVRSNERWSERTQEAYLSQVGEFFNWLESESDSFRSPFRKLRVFNNKSGREPVDRAFSSSDLRVLVRSNWPSLHLSASFLIGLFSGMRLEEIYNLRIDDVEFGAAPAVKIKSAKNSNSIRKVPLHSVIQPLVSRLVETSFDGFLIAGLNPSGGGRMRRSHHVSGVFSSWRSRLGVAASKTFHSTRHTFSTCLRDQGLGEEQIAAIIGHRKQSTTAGYLSRPALERLRDWVECLNYGEDIQGDALRLVLAHPGNPMPDEVRATARTPMGSLVQWD